MLYYTDSGLRHTDSVYDRLAYLERAVFGNAQQSNQSTSSPSGGHRHADRSQPKHTPAAFTPLSSCDDSEASDTSTQYLQQLVAKLPPEEQANIFVQYLSKMSIQHWIVLQVPSSKLLVSNLYTSVRQGILPTAEDLLFTFTTLACLTFAWSPQLLSTLGITAEQALRASRAYTKCALSLVNDEHKLIKPSVTALMATSNLSQFLLHAQGLENNVEAMRLRMYLIGMMQTMDLARLDTPARKQQRQQDGYSMLDVEMLRRVWWNNVGHDWLGGFSGGVCNGTFLFQPQHMRVDLPSHTDDANITAEAVVGVKPLSERTEMSSFIYRIKIAEICREAVEMLPSQFDDTQDINYAAVLRIDEKFNNLIQSLPEHFRLTTSDAASSETDGPDYKNSAFNMSKLTLNFAILCRLCRLHRRHFIQGMHDPRFKYSHTACVRAAQEALELRARMEEHGKTIGMFTSRSRVLMHHSFVAALVLATDVSFNSGTPLAEKRRLQVLTMCDNMERSVDQPGAFAEGVQQDIQTLVSTLRQGKMQQTAQLESTSMGLTMAQSSEFEDLDRLFADFVELAPEMDSSQWDFIFESIQC